MEGVPLPPDEERCRRRGTPNWRCPQRALPGKSHCLKHYLFYVSRRNRQKTTSVAGKPGGGERIPGGGAGDSCVEPYRPVLDFDLQKQPVQTGLNDQITLPGGCGGNQVGEMIMGRFGEADLWNAEIALGDGEPSRGSDVANDQIALGGGQKNKVIITDAPEEATPEEKEKVTEEKKRKEDEFVCRGGHILNSLSDRLYDLYVPKSSKYYNTTERQGTDTFDKLKLMGKLEGVANLDGIELQKPKRGRPKGSKNKKKGEELGHTKRRENVGGIDQDDSVQRRENMRWIMRDSQFSDSDSEKEDDIDDQTRSIVAQRDEHEGLWHKFGDLPTNFNGGNYMILPKKRGRPKGSKNKLKIHS